MSSATRNLISIVVGVAVGVGICKLLLAPPTVPLPGLVACTTPTGTDQEVNIDVVDGTITVDHDYVVVRVDECEQIVWIFDTTEYSEVTVATEWERKADPRARNPETGELTPPGLPGRPAPPNPFPGEFTGGSGPVFSETSTDGTLESGLAHNNTPGHEYKFTITVTKVDGTVLDYDPHTRFD